MKLNDLIKELQRLQENYGEHEIVVECPNGLLVSPTIKFNRKDKMDVLNRSPENTKNLVITWQ